MMNPNTPAFGEAVAETTSLDLPPALASILNMPMPGQQIPSFQEGGFIDIQSFYGRGPRRKPPAATMFMAQQPSEMPAPPDPNLPVFTAQQPSEMPQNTGAGGGGMGLAGMGMGGMGLRPMGSSLPADRKKPTVTVEEIPQKAGMDISYAEGGMVGLEGMRVPVGAVPGMPQQAGINPEMQAGAPMNPRMLEMQINQFVNKNPQQVAQIRQAIMEELQSGALTAQELNMIVQLATVAAQNPEMYPNVRNYAIQQGIAAEEDLPPQYDQGLVFILLLAARAVQQDLGGQNMMQGGTPAMAQAPAIPSMATGGKVPGKDKSEPVIIEAHTGEYVIPKHVVDMKGKEFFDSLVEKYKGK